MSDGAKFFLIMFAVIAGLAMLGGGGYVIYTHYAERGYRNNNPGNLDKTRIAWKGKVPHSRNDDGRFEQFEEFEGLPGHIWGIRAAYMDIRGDVLKDGLNTVRKLISTYAPPHENNTAAYIAAVAKAIGKSADAVLTVADLKPALLAIFRHENNGKMPYPSADIDKAISLA